MTLRATELAAVCVELEALLGGQPVHKIVQPDDQTVLIGLRGRWLLISVSPRAGRIHLTDEKPPGTGEAAPAFCMLLRKHLIGARLSSVTAIEGERACELSFVNADDTPRLRLFLFGMAAQLQLVARQDDRDRVLGSTGPARRTYDALPPPHPGAAAAQIDRYTDRKDGETPISRAIDADYTALERETTVAAAKKASLQRIDEEAQRLARLIDRLNGDLSRVESAEGRRKEGDLLLAHLHEVPRGASSVTLPDDFTDGAPVEIALDPARSAKDNAARLYKEHKRLHRARGAIERRLAEAIVRAEKLAAERIRVAALGDVAIIAGARGAPPSTKAARQRQEATRRALPYKSFRSATGVPIYVGRGASKNDELTFKVARGNDLWLHTRDVPGAHVIVPLDGGRPVDPETLIDAATLAALHSPAREEAQVDVGYALRKHLRKPKGAAPGAVMVAQQKTIRVRLEPARVERLMAAQVVER